MCVAVDNEEMEYLTTKVLPGIAGKRERLMALRAGDSCTVVISDTLAGLIAERCSDVQTAVGFTPDFTMTTEGVLLQRLMDKFSPYFSSR